MMLCASINVMADETKTGTGTATTIGSEKVTLDLSTYSTLYLTGGHGTVENNGANFDYMCNGAYAKYNITNNTEQKYTIGFTAGTKGTSDVKVTITITNANSETEYENVFDIEQNGSWTYTSVAYSITTSKALTTGDKVLKIAFSASSTTTANVGGVYFEPSTAETYNVTAKSADETMGTVSANPTFAEGENVKLTANPASILYAFNSWTYSVAGGAEQTSTDNPLTISAPAGDITATASFKEADGQSVPGTLDLTASDLNNCIIESSGGNIGYAYEGSTADYLINVATKGQYKVTVAASYGQKNTVSFDLIIKDVNGNQLMSQNQSVPAAKWSDYNDYTFTTPTLAAGKYILELAFHSSSNNSCNVNKIALESTTVETITLNEGTTPTLTVANGVNVALKRQLTAGVWNSICLPFAMSATQIKAAFGEARVAAMSSEATSETVSFSTVDAIEANKPYLIFVETANTTPATIEGVNISADGAETVSSSGVQFIGNYEAAKTMTGDNYFVYNNNIVKGGNSNTLNAFRAYFTATSGAKMNLVIDGETTTAINAVEFNTNDNAETYNLAGQRVAGNYKGIVVKSGKKVIR